MQDPQTCVAPESADAASVASTAGAGDKAMRTHVRGSTMLLFGRVLFTLIGFLAQVLMVRYLSTREYGAIAWGLSVATFCQTFTTLGLQRAIPRFVPIYHEERDYPKMLGTIVILTGIIAISVLVIVLMLFAVPHSLLRSFTRDREPLALLSILAFLIPVEALNELLVSLFACFSRTRQIFLRCFVVAPGIKLVSVLLLMATHSTARFLALGLVVGSTVSVLAFSVMMADVLRREGIWEHLSWRNIDLPMRELFSFALPMLSSDLVTSLTMNATAVFLLGYYANLTEVAVYRAAAPIARLNFLAMNSFSLLFTPLASRFFAKRDHVAVNTLYWKTAVFVAVLTFPVFALTFSMAKPLTIMLYGPRYAASGMVLALLAAGHYFDVALGYNVLVLRVYSKLGWIMSINAICVVFNIAVSLAFIPRYGALGAAFGTAFTLILLNLLTQFGLRWTGGVKTFDRAYAYPYLVLAASAIGLFLLQFLLPTNSYKGALVALPLAAAVSLAAFAVIKKDLEITKYFPELAKIPILRAICA